MGIDFENLVDMSMGMGIIFKNTYGCGYNYTRPTPIPRRNEWMLSHKYPCASLLIAIESSRSHSQHGPVQNLFSLLIKIRNIFFPFFY